MSKYLDEYVLGEHFVSAARTVTECDVVNFACMFGQRIAHGLLGISWAHGFLDRLDLITDSAIAFLEIEEWKFKAPIFFGDTIHAEITVKDVIPSRSKPDRGVLKLYFELIKQDGTVCQSGTKAIMMKRTAQKEG